MAVPAAWRREAMEVSMAFSSWIRSWGVMMRVGGSGLGDMVGWWTRIGRDWVLELGILSFLDSRLILEDSGFGTPYVRYHEPLRDKGTSKLRSLFVAEILVQPKSDVKVKISPKPI